MMLNSKLLGWLRSFRPSQSKTALPDHARSVAGSLVAILVTGLVTRSAFGAHTDVPLLIAPMGASAVLLFAVPASPLAQPWAAIGGNTLGGILGVASARCIPDPMYAAATAVSLTIGATAFFRCLHPPAGAVALTAVVGGPPIAEAGFHFGAPNMGATLRVQVPPRGDHPDRSEPQLRKGDQPWEGSG